MITIKSKALKVGDSFKIKRTSYTATKIIDLDPTNNSSCPHRANKILVMSGCRQFVFLKSSELLINDNWK